MAMGAEDRSKFAAPFTGNGDVNIWVKNSGVERKTPNKQTDSMAETLSNQAISLSVMHMRDYQFII